MRKIVYPLISVLVSVISIAQDSTPVSLLPSTQWQKIKLEQEVDTKIKNVLSPLISPENIIVEVNIEVAEPSTPQFVKTEPTPEEKAAEQKEKKKKKSKTIRINDELPKELPEDYIIFSKLGLEAPLIEDVLKTELEKLKSIAEGEVKSDLEPKDEGPKVNELPKLEQAWNYNSSIDIFKNLLSVKAVVKIDQGMPQTKKDDIDKLLKSLKLSYGEIQAQISLEFIQLKQDNIPDDLLSYIEYASKFSSLLAAVVGTMLLGIFSLLLFKKYEKLKREEMEKGSGGQDTNINITNPEKEDEDKAQEALAAGGGSGNGTDSEDTEYIGITRFRHYLKTSKEMAIILTKRWIALEEKSPKLALKAIVQQLDTDELQKIFSNLNEKQRSDWREKLDGPLNKQELILANKYISNEIIADIMIPNVVEDTELQELLLDISPEKGAKLLNSEQEYGVVLTQLLSSTMLSNIYKLVEPQTVDQILNESINFNHDKLPSSLPKLKAALQGLQSANEQSEVIEKIIKILPKASRELEGIYFEKLASKVSKEQFTEVALETFPSALVSELPNQFMQIIFKTFNNSEKAEILFATPEELKEQLTEQVAPLGSKARDMLDMEFERVEQDEELLKSIEKNPEEYWDKLISQIRKEIKTNKSIKGDITNIIESWEICPAEDQSDDHVLKMAA